MKKIILLIVIITRLAADTNLPSVIQQSLGWFRTGWACMDIWNQEHDSIIDLNAWFTNNVAKAILNASNNEAANVIIPPNFVIYAANQAQSGNPWPLINFFFQYVASINQVINTWISNNQTYLQNVSNACTAPITSTNFDCNLLPSLTLQDLYEPIINDIFNTYTYGSTSVTPSSFANMTSYFGSLGQNFVDGTINMKINTNNCGSPNPWPMASIINTNSISVPAWTLFTSLLTANYSQQVGSNGKSSINSMNTFGSFGVLEYVPAGTVSPNDPNASQYKSNLIRIATTLATVQCLINSGYGCIGSWSDNNSNNFATYGSGAWQSSPCTGPNSPVLSAQISKKALVGSNWQYTGFCLPKQSNWTKQWYSGIMNGCEIMTQI